MTKFVTVTCKDPSRYEPYPVTINVEYISYFLEDPGGNAEIYLSMPQNLVGGVQVNTVTAYNVFKSLVAKASGDSPT